MASRTVWPVHVPIPGLKILWNPVDVVAGEHWWPLTLFCSALHQVQPCPHYWGQSGIALENSESKLQQIALLIFRKSDLMLGDLSPFLLCCSFWLLEMPILKYNHFHGLPIALPILWERMFACSRACSAMCPGMPKDLCHGWEGSVYVWGEWQTSPFRPLEDEEHRFVMVELHRRLSCMKSLMVHPRSQTQGQKPLSFSLSAMHSLSHPPGQEENRKNFQQVFHFAKVKC